MCEVCWYKTMAIVCMTSSGTLYHYGYPCRLIGAGCGEPYLKNESRWIPEDLQLGTEGMFRRNQGAAPSNRYGGVGPAAAADGNPESYYFYCEASIPGFPSKVGRPRFPD